MKKSELIEAILDLDPEAETKGMNKAGLEALLNALEHPPTKNMAATLQKYRKSYKPCHSASGRQSLNNGDKLAQALEGLDNLQVLAAAERVLGLEAGELVTRYASLNLGAQRMNAGNRIRAAIKRGDITIDEAVAAIH